jgi:hypothetical protein
VLGREVESSQASHDELARERQVTFVQDGAASSS